MPDPNIGAVLQVLSHMDLGLLKFRFRDSTTCCKTQLNSGFTILEPYPDI